MWNGEKTERDWLEKTVKRSAPIGRCRAYLRIVSRPEENETKRRGRTGTRPELRRDLPQKKKEEQVQTLKVNLHRDKLGREASEHGIGCAGYIDLYYCSSDNGGTEELLEWVVVPGSPRFAGRYFFFVCHVPTDNFGEPTQVRVSWCGCSGLGSGWRTHVRKDG